MKLDGAQISQAERDRKGDATAKTLAANMSPGVSRFREVQPEAERLITIPGEPINTPPDHPFKPLIVHPDDNYIGECFEHIIKLEQTCPSRNKTYDGINAILTEMAGKAEKEGSSYSTMVDSLLMLYWTRDMANDSAYNIHMQGHVDAISVLVKAWLKDRHFPSGKIKILDASCGTGTVLEVFLDSLPNEVLKRVRVVANDVSSASIEDAKVRLARFGDRVRFTRFDLNQETPGGKFDFVIFSQTLGLICDENALRAQRLGLAVPNETRHFTAKKRLLERLFNKVKPQRGELLLIDEDPMRLSRMPEEFDGIVEDGLFKEIFRPVDKNQLISDILKRIPHARFKVHTETFIDREHLMFLISSTVDRNEVRTHYTETEENQHNIMRDLRKMHPDLAARLQTFDDPKLTKYRFLGSGCKELVIDKRYYEENIEGKPHYWHKNGSYDLVVISGLIHELGVEESRSLVEKLKRSRKLEAGAGILFMDHWPAPYRSPLPVGNGDARTIIMNSFDDQVFCGAVRYGNEYGYLYLVRNLSLTPSQERFEPVG